MPTEASASSSAAHASFPNESRPDGQKVRLSGGELVAMTRGKSAGNKAATVEQKRLREHCFANGLWEIDLSDSTYDWKQLLKAMPETKSQKVGH